MAELGAVVRLAAPANGLARKNLLLAGLTLATGVEIATTTSINIVLPDMTGSLAASFDQASWVVTVYSTAFLIVLLLTAWLQDHLGRRFYLGASLVLYAIAAAGCATSQTLPEILIWRFIQGAAGGAFLSRSQTALYAVFTGPARGGAIAIFGVGVLAIKAILPLLAAYLTDLNSWRFTFWSSASLASVAAAVVFIFGTEPDAPAHPITRHIERPDWVGFLVLAVGVGSLQIVLSRGQREDWFGSPLIVTFTCLSLLCLPVFLWWVLRPQNRHPIVDISLLSNRAFAFGLMLAGLFGVILSGGLYLLPQYLRNIETHNAGQTAGYFLIDSLVATLTIPITGKLLLSRFDKKFVLASAMACFTASMWIFADKLTTDSPLDAIVPALILRGLAIGLVIPSVSASAIGLLPAGQTSRGAALYNFSRQFGASVAVAAITLLIDLRETLHSGRLIDRFTSSNGAFEQTLTGAQRALAAHGQTPDQAQLAAYKVTSRVLALQSNVLAYADIFWLMGWFGVAGVVIALAMPRKPKTPAIPTPAEHIF